MCESRPDFDELCGCAGIILSAPQQAHFDRLDQQGRVNFMRSVYNHGADYYIDGDCAVCKGTGYRPVSKAA